MKNILLDIKLFAVLLLVLGSNVELRAQGCVAIRTVGGLNTMEHSMMHGMMHDSNVSKMAEPKWELNISGRYFKSYKHFNGTDEQTQRVDEQTDVRNFSRTLDISLLRKVNEKWSIGFDLPLVYNERSSLYEHVGSAIGNPRFSTFSQGIGDIRIAAYKWLIAPRIGAKGNLLAGIGLKMPTGNFKSEDIFHYKLGSSILTRKGPVDQSIQPGDGGWGMTIELNAFRQLNNSLSTYGNVYYLINPKGNNGVSTARGGIASASAIKYTSDVMSVPDQYLLRAGTNFTTNNFTLSLGVRYECIPAKDIIGDNTGFRRPGNVLALEPGANYNYKKFNFYLYAPIAIRRERPQSYPDILKTNDTNVFSRGDAAFADYSISLGFGYKF
ncbi:MAG: hypothetical protein RIR64_839 [Bacteroidota bacterium]